ncbi:hypothetical protein Tco_0738345, partial [Tanacetum coccineum]
SNCTVKPGKRDAAYLQTQLQIAQKEEAGIQLNSEEFDFMATTGAYDEIEEATANCNLQDNLQQATTSGTQSDKAPVYVSDGSDEVHQSENCYDNDIFNMFTQEEQYTDVLKPIPEPNQVQQNDSIVISAVSIEKVNLVNRKMKETNADLTTELARYKNQEKCFEISQEKYDKLERCYQKSVYQEQRLTKKINALHLSSDKQITTLNEEIENLNKQLSKENSTISSLLEEKKRLKSDFKIREDELLDKQIQLENKIKELDNILLSRRKHRGLYNGKVLLEKHDPPVVYDSEETLEHAQEKAAKFVRDFKSLAKEADESLAKHKALELEIERLLRAVVSQDIMSIVQNNSVVDTSNLQTELERTKERFENCIIKKENEYAKLWNDWYKKCEECKYDKISYDKAYNDMQQKIERLQAQLGDQKGKSKDTPCVSNTLDPLPQKLENENVELEFQVRNYEKENAHLKTTYKNMFDSIKVTHAQTKAIIDSLQDKLHDTIYENAKLRAQLFDKVSEQKDTNKGTSVNTQFSKQSILGKPPSSSKPKLYSVTPFPKSTVIPKVGKSNALSKPVTSNSAPSSRESTVVNNERVNAPIFRINPFKASREDVNSNRNGFSPNNVESTTRTRRPQPRNNPKNDKVPFKSKSSCLLNKLEKKEENHRSLQSSNYPDHTSSECNNSKLAIQNKKSEGPKKDLLYLSLVHLDLALGGHQLEECLTLKGKIIATSESECQSDCFKGDNACTSNLQEPISKWFPNSTFSMTGGQNWFDTLLIPLLFEYKPKDREDHRDNECES